MNGKHGDHPINDILVHEARVFSMRIDDLIRKIDAIAPGELERIGIDWFNPPANDILESILTGRFCELLEDASNRGWEVERFE